MEQDTKNSAEVCCTPPPPVRVLRTTRLMNPGQYKLYTLLLVHHLGTVLCSATELHLITIEHNNLIEQSFLKSHKNMLKIIVIIKESNAG